MSTPAKKQASGSKTAAERMRDYRERMRQKGFRQKTTWVLDTGNPEVIDYYRRSALAIAADVSEEAEVMAWLEAAQEELLKDEPPYDWGDGAP